MDPGYRMLEERDSHNVQTEGIDTILFINGELVGNPGEKTLTKITLAPKEDLNTLIFHTNYTVPDHKYTYITITVSRWSKSWKSGDADLTKLATIEVPMVRCQEDEPELEVLTKVAAAELLGVDECKRMATKYVVTGAPRFFHSDSMSSLTNEKNREASTGGRQSRGTEQDPGQLHRRMAPGWRQAMGHILCQVTLKAHA